MSLSMSTGIAPSAWLAEPREVLDTALVRFARENERIRDAT